MAHDGAGGGSLPVCSVPLAGRDEGRWLSAPLLVPSSLLQSISGCGRGRAVPQGGRSSPLGGFQPRLEMARVGSSSAQSLVPPAPRLCWEGDPGWSPTCCRDEPVPHTTSHWVSKLPPHSFRSSQFARGLGDWAALWGGDPLLQRRRVLVLGSCCRPLPLLGGCPGRAQPAANKPPEGVCCSVTLRWVKGSLLVTCSLVVCHVKGFLGPASRVGVGPPVKSQPVTPRR